MVNKKGGELICKRPETIIEARFNLTKKQNDIMDMVFATIENDDKLKYEIDIAKYGQLYNIKDKSNIYRDLKKAVKSFEGKGFAITQKISEKKENRIYFSWFSSIHYLDGESKIIVELGQTLKEIMLSAKQACFYQIKYTLNFHNIYSKRLYYYLKSYENSNKNGTGWRIDNLDELRSKLECPKSYNVYYEFKRFVLNPAYDEINGNSDISFEYEEIKTKSKVTAIKFYIKPNEAQNEKTDTQTDAEAPKVQISEDEAFGVKRVKAIMNEHKNITDIEALKILKSSKGDFAVIQRVYNHFKNKQLNSVVGNMIAMVKPGVFQEPIKNYKIDNFNNFEQRTYDYDDLEKKLLGCGNIKNSENVN